MANHKQLMNTKNQSGLVSIIVTVIIMTVLTLIVLSFAKISRQEQRNALDRQLSTQAYYAAESGVNDAREVLQDWTNTNSPNLSGSFMDTCDQFPAASAGAITTPKTLAGTGAASYTCLLVDPTPPDIVFSKSNTQHIFPLEDVDGDPIGSLLIEWEDPDATFFGGCGAFSGPKPNPISLPAVCGTPILRIEIVDASNLTQNKVFFLYPRASAEPNLNYSSDDTGSSAYGACDTNQRPHCRATIDGLTASKYYFRISTIYGAAAIRLSDTTSGTEFKGAQSIVDATGKATDVLRRIQVRINASDFSSDSPEFAIEGTDKICKRYTIGGGSTADDEGSCWAGANPD